MAEFWNPTGLRLIRRLALLWARGQKSPLPAHLRSESHSQMEGFQAEDRHNPLPHIALLTTALKSAYRNAVFSSTRTVAELLKLLIPGRPGMIVFQAAALRL